MEKKWYVVERDETRDKTVLYRMKRCIFGHSAQDEQRVSTA